MDRLTIVTLGTGGEAFLTRGVGGAPPPKKSGVGGPRPARSREQHSRTEAPSILPHSTRAPQKPEIPTPVPPSPIPKRSELIYLQTACKRGKYGVYLSLKRIKRKVGNTGKIKWA